jgi:galactokinase
MIIVRAPGRVNLIGEHTDYNGGFVMPAAIQLAATISLVPRSNQTLVVHSDAANETVSLDLSTPLQPQHHWSDYVAGVAAVLIDAGHDIHGGDMRISSDVPRGAGLSSSAALEVAAGFAMLTATGEPIERLTLAKWCQTAENDFVGARCGIMDQYVACFGQPDTALVLDCQSLQSRQVSLSSDVSIVVLNTMVKHAIATGEYNARRRECEMAAETLAATVPHCKTLRAVTTSDLAEHGHCLAPNLLKRATHVVTENARVLEAALALQRGDLRKVGELMSDSHRSLRDDFEVSCAELDLMVGLAATEPGLIGTRMTGGGFGGCTVSLVDRSAATQFLASMQQRYEDTTGMRPDGWICTASSGVEQLVSTP